MFEDVAQWIRSGAWAPVATRIVAAIAIIAGAVVVKRLMEFWLERMRRATRNNDASRILYVIEKVGGYVLIVVAVAAALSRLGLNLQSLSLFAGALGVGVGLGLQGVVKEFFSGLQLIFNPAVRVGDFVELEDGLRGEIVEIGTRSTRLRTNDYVSIVVPNSTMIQSRVINWTFSEAPRRLHIPFSVIETADKAQVRDIVLKAAHKLPFTLPDTDTRRTQVWLTSFAGDGLEFELIVWPDPESCRHPAAMHAAYMWAIHDALAAADIDNAAPQLDLRLQRLFGTEGDKALQALGVAVPQRSHVRAKAVSVTPPTTNDAASAVFDDTERDAIVREQEPTRRSPPPAAPREHDPR